MTTHEKIKQKLIEQSANKEYPDLLKEWVFTGDMAINEESNSVCSLCGQTNLYYEYFILNNLNGTRLLVGSQCICKFIESSELGIKDVEGNAYNNCNSFKKRARRSAIEYASKIILPLINEGAGDFDMKDFMINVLKKVVADEALSPKQASLFAVQIDKSSLSQGQKKLIYDITKTSLRKDIHKDQVNELNHQRFNALKLILSKQQLEKVKELRDSSISKLF